MKFKINRKIFIYSVVIVTTLVLIALLSKEWYYHQMLITQGDSFQQYYDLPSRDRELFVDLYDYYDDQLSGPAVILNIPFNEISQSDYADLAINIEFANVNSLDEANRIVQLFIEYLEDNPDISFEDRQLVEIIVYDTYVLGTDNKACLVCRLSIVSNMVSSIELTINSNDIICTDNDTVLDSVQTVMVENMEELSEQQIEVLCDCYPNAEISTI